MIHHGHLEKSSAKGGGAILLSEYTRNAWTTGGMHIIKPGDMVEGNKAARLLGICLNFRCSKPTQNLTIRNAYAPHSGYVLEKRETFYEKLQHVVKLEKTNKRLVIIGGDLNASISTRAESPNAQNLI